MLLRRVVRVRRRLLMGGIALRGIGGRRPVLRWLAVGCWSARCFGASDHLSCNDRVQILVLIEANILAAPRPVKSLDGDFAHVLSPQIQLYDAVDTLSRLTLDDLVFWHAGMEEHGVCSQTFGLESSLDPGHKVSVEVVLEDELYIRHIGAVSLG